MEDVADDDFSPWQEGTSPTLVSVPNPVFGTHDDFCEPFDVSVGGEGCRRGSRVWSRSRHNRPSSQDSLLGDFPDTQRILAVK